ncbi:hypothetical protein [Streptomyces sp. NPDC051546]|uniref:hypothetical protein n=1 Tax=Streptomyces sp. NPDC051546 TaxID=3365655 RepID=UPI0037A539FE
MNERRPLGTGPRRTTDSPNAPSRGRLAAELAEAAPAVDPAGLEPQPADTPRRRRLGTGGAAAER